MDKQQLLGYFQDHYLSRQDVLFKLPLNISIDSFWQDLVNQRKARATMLPLYSATGQPDWFVTTDKMVKASERLCEEAMKHDSFFDPYRIPLSQSLTSALSQEAYFTSFVEGADYPIQAAVDFLRRGSEPENAYEQNIMNNYQAGSYLLSALSIPFDEGFVKELAATLTDGQDGYRTTDTPGIPAMEGEPYMVPPAHMLADRMGQFYAFLADVRVHPKGWNGETLSGYIFLAVDSIEIRREVVEVARLEGRAEELEGRAGPCGMGTTSVSGGGKAELMTPADHAAQIRQEIDVRNARLTPRLDFACEVLYGRSGRGGLAQARSYTDADIITGYYLQGLTWPQVAKELTQDIDSKWPAQWCRSRAMSSIVAMERIGLLKLADS